MCLWCIADARRGIASGLAALDAARHLDRQSFEVTDAVTTVDGDAVCLAHAIRATDIILARGGPWQR